MLLSADLAAFGILRELYRSVGEEAPTRRLARQHGAAAPPTGYLDGWLDALALVLGLTVIGNYGAGDRRRDPGRLFWSCALATALLLWAPLWERGIGPVALQFGVTTLIMRLGLVAIRFALEALDAQLVKRNPLPPARFSWGRLTRVGTSRGVVPSPQESY